jgi:hypothetical protein
VGIESHDVTADFDLADSIGLYVTKPLGKESHQRFVAWTELLSLSVVWIARRGMTRKETFDRSNFDRSGVRGSHQARELRGTGGGSLPRVRNRKELERAVGLARINKSRARPLEFVL